MIPAENAKSEAAFFYQEWLSWLDVEGLLKILPLEMRAWLEMPSDNVYVERPEQHLNGRKTKTVTTSG